MRAGLLIFIFFYSIGLWAQDPILSQYNSLPLYNNMAMAGSKGCSRVTMGTRLQWLKVDGGYRTTYVSYDQYSGHLQSGFGFQYVNTNEADGRMKTDMMHYVFSPAISLGRRGEDSIRPIVIKPALNFGAIIQQIDWSKFSPGDMIDSTYGFIASTYEVKNIDVITAPDFGIGLAVYGKRGFGGLYFHHLTEPDMAFMYPVSPYPFKFTFISGYSFIDRRWLGDLELTPTFIYERQGASNRADISISSQYKHFMLGFGTRLSGALVFSGGYENKYFKIGYAYDLNTAVIRNALGSTHEMNLTYKFAHRKTFKRIRALEASVF